MLGVTLVELDVIERVSADLIRFAIHSKRSDVVSKVTSLIGAIDMAGGPVCARALLISVRVVADHPITIPVVLLIHDGRQSEREDMVPDNPSYDNRIRHITSI